MSKEFILFDKDELSFKGRFYRLMDLLVANQSSSRMECLIFLGIFYIQIISGFFSVQVEVMDIENSSSDLYLNYVEKIFRVKDLFIDNYSGFGIAIYLLLGALVLFALYFVLVLMKISKSTFYTYKEFILNFILKTFLYVAFIPILDLVLANLCFEDTNINPLFSNASCTLTDNLPLFIISLILILYSIFLSFFLQIFYNDSLFLSSSPLAKMSCGYEIYMTLNCIIYSILLSQAKYLSKEIFLIYNLIISLIFLKFFASRYLFYDKTTNTISGMFHLLYAWTSLFFLIFAYVTIYEKGVIYIVSAVIILYFYFHLKFKLEEKILMNTPFHKITNKYYLLYYVKNLIDKIHNIEENVEEKALLIGIIQVHINECPNEECIAKKKDKKIYLPITDEWSMRDQPEISDKVFLLNFILAIMNYFISQSYYSPDMLINISLYYLQIIGNYCQSMFFYKKVKEMKLTLQEKFSFRRLNFAISKTLVEKLKLPNEICTTLEDLNTALYFKYEDLSQQFYDEISNDVSLTLEFWKSFKNSPNESSKTIDFNKVFHLTDKIRITKNKVEKIWNMLYHIYNGVNELFELYLTYIEQINDDDLLKRELDAIKRKNENSADHIQQNFYNILFNKETGILIANGDKGKEGIIEKANNEIENIFRYKAEELRGMNVSHLMPKLFEKQHKSFMEKYFEIGERKVLDKEFQTYAKDKENSIISVRNCVKLFPMLNESVYFVAMIIRENVDDVIFIDSKFNIQGMSKKLMEKLVIENRNLFQDCEIPFYIICKKFVTFYKIFLRGKRKPHKDNASKLKKTGTVDDNGLEPSENTAPLPEEKGATSNLRTNAQNTTDNIEAHENVEINENIELEYEIRIPQFIIDYASCTNKKDNAKFDMKIIKTSTETSEADLKDHNETVDEYEENDYLVEEQSSAKDKQHTGVHKAKNQKIDFGRQSEEEKEFHSKINIHREFFEAGNFSALEDQIDSCFADSAMQEFKFNFTFDRKRFGDKQVAYVIRCIDNKNENLKSDEESDKLEKDQRVAYSRTKKLEALSNLKEVLQDEKQELIEMQMDFLKLSLENKNFNTILNLNKDEINNYSVIHGHKKEDVTMDDENSSQSSQAGFNEDLSKKSRIEEIRANIMQNVTNFYTLKYIKAIFFLVIIITAGFCGCYLTLFDMSYRDLTTISSINIGLFQTTIWMSNLVSSIISMRALYNLTASAYPMNFNSYISNSTEYFEALRKFSFNWYDDIIREFGVIENKIGYFVTDSGTIFWGSEDVTYQDINMHDDEALPLGLGQVLSDINNLLKNRYFNTNTNLINQANPHQKQFISYSGFIGIENAINNLLPQQFSKLKTLPNIFMDFNQQNMKYIVIAIIAYSFTMVLLVLFYWIFLYSTNKNMGEGLEKVTKIKEEKIEDEIKKIEAFNNSLKKCRDKEVKTLTEEVKDTKVPDQHGNIRVDKNIGGFNNESRRHKTLKILSYSYLQIVIFVLLLCAILIPIYFVSQGMVESTNQIISVQNYIFGKSLIASASTVSIKCMISQCLISKDLQYSDLIDKSQIQSIVRGISSFPELSDFYNNKFLLNACDTVFNKTADPDSYNSCMADVLIQSANNTDSLLKLIDETVDNINKDRQMKQDKLFTLLNKKTVPFSTILLFDTGSFKDLENVFYKYITPISDNFSNVATVSLANYLNSKRVMIIILICALGVIIVIFSCYVAFFFTKKLIHLLSVSRCILRIIPTIVINNTQELETWIENKY